MSNPTEFLTKPWRATVNIKKHLNDINLTWRQAALKVADTLANSKHFNDTDFDDDLQCAARDPDAGPEEFTEILNQVYNYADFYRIWMGI